MLSPHKALRSRRRAAAMGIGDGDSEPSRTSNNSYGFLPARRWRAHSGAALPEQSSQSGNIGAVDEAVRRVWRDIVLGRCGRYRAAEPGGQARDVGAVDVAITVEVRADGRLGRLRLVGSAIGLVRRHGVALDVRAVTEQQTAVDRRRGWLQMQVGRAVEAWIGQRAAGAEAELGRTIV